MCIAYGYFIFAFAAWAFHKCIDNLQNDKMVDMRPLFHERLFPQRSKLCLNNHMSKTCLNYEIFTMNVFLTAISAYI